MTHATSKRRQLMAFGEYRMRVQQLGLRPTLAQHRACLFLARHGQKFLVDFGLDNARDKAQMLRAGYKP